jgi:hypothetical protein
MRGDGRGLGTRNAQRVAALSEASRQTLNRLLVREGHTRLALRLRTSRDTMLAAASGAAFQASTRQRLETAIAKLEREE